MHYTAHCHLLLNVCAVFFSLSQIVTIFSLCPQTRCLPLCPASCSLRGAVRKASPCRTSGCSPSRSSSTSSSRYVTWWPNGAHCRLLWSGQGAISSGGSGMRVSDTDSSTPAPSNTGPVVVLIRLKNVISHVKKYPRNFNTETHAPVFSDGNYGNLSPPPLFCLLLLWSLIVFTQGKHQLYFWSSMLYDLNVKFYSKVIKASEVKYRSWPRVYCWCLTAGLVMCSTGEAGRGEHDPELQWGPLQRQKATGWSAADARGLQGEDWVSTHAYAQGEAEQPAWLVLQQRRGATER